MPELGRRVRLLVSNLSAKGVNVEVTQGLRTFAEQDALYSQGRSRRGPKVTNAKGGYSFHNYGLAVDLAPFKRGVPDWNAANAFRLIGEEAKKVRLEWGGRWKTPDRPHVQLAPLPIAKCLSLYKGGGLGLVWAAVEVELGKVK